MLNNQDKLDYMIALAAMKCAEEDAKAFNDLDTSDVVFDASYYKKRKKIINKYKRGPAMKTTGQVLIRLAAAIMIIVTLSVVLIGCVPGLRKAIYDAIVGWYNEYFTVRYENPDGYEKETRHSGPLETESAAVEMIAPTYIEEVRKPSNLPDGVWEDVISQNNTQITIDYYIGEEYLFSYTQMVLKVNDKYIDNDEVSIRPIDINGNDGTVIEYTEKNELNIIWSDNVYSYHIFSTECDLETLLKYAERVE